MLKKLTMFVLVLILCSPAEAGLLSRMFGGGQRQNYAPRQPDIQVDALEEAMNCLQRVNEERIRRKLRPLQYSQELAEASVAWSRTMAGSGFRHGASREIIAVGGYSSEFAYRIWMNSPPHRAALLNSRYKEVGFGMERGYWTGRFK